jgi:uncharacterized membrane protein
MKYFTLGTALVATLAACSTDQPIAPPSQTSAVAMNQTQDPPTSVTITDLGLLPGGTHSGGSGVSQINDLGQVVGPGDVMENGVSVPHGYMWSADRGMRDLGSTLTGSFGGPLSVNGSSAFVGSTKVVVDGVEREQAYLAQSKSSYRILDLPQGAANAFGFDLNDLGQVAGTAWSGAVLRSTAIAYTWSSWQGTRTLAPLSAGAPAEARAINIFGQVAGHSVLNGLQEAVRWSSFGVPQKLGALEDAGYPSSVAWNINDAGTVVGAVYGGTTFSAAATLRRAVSWTVRDGVQMLGIPYWPECADPTVSAPCVVGTVAFGINKRGDIVGRAEWKLESGATEFRGVLWRKSGEVVELPTLPGGYLTIAYGINNNGQVSGVVRISPSATHAVVWNTGRNR